MDKDWTKKARKKIIFLDFWKNLPEKSPSKVSPKADSVSSFLGSVWFVETEEKEEEQLIYQS